MRIIVFVKQICDIYARSGLAPEENFLAPEDKIYRLNPHDEAALEIALRIKDEPVQCEVLVVTLGPLIAEPELKRCLALGADGVYWIDFDSQVDSWRKSYFLARAAKDLGADLILCGKESLDGGSGQTGAFLAHRLGLPFIASASLLSVSGDGESAQAERKAGRGVREIHECRLPAVVSVEVGVDLRLPKFSNRNRSIVMQRLRYDEKEGDDARMKVRRVFPPRPRPKPITAPDSGREAFFRIQQLLSGSPMRKTGAVIKGDPHSQVEEIIAFLMEHELLKSGEPQL